MLTVTFKIARFNIIVINSVFQVSQEFWNCLEPQNLIYATTDHNAVVYLFGRGY